MIRWLSILGIVVLVIVAFLLWRPSSEAPSSAKGPGAPGGPGGPPPMAKGIVASTQEFTESVQLTGTVVANESVDVTTEIGGRIVRLGFTEGGRVRKGQVLVKLWDDDLRARLAKAERQLKLDEDRAKRLQDLKPVDGVSTQDLDVAMATVDMRRAEIDELRALLSRTEIRAPFDGRVGIRSVSEGAVVHPQTRITTLVDDAGLKVDCNVPERYAAGLRPGSTLDVVIRGANAPRRAVVIAVDPALREDTRTLRVRARLQDARNVVAGMFADVQLTLDAVRDAVLVPTESVVQDINGASVFVVKDGKAVKRIVTLGGRTPTHVRVLDGVAVGDTVLTTGLLFVKKNMPVSVRL